MTAAIPGVGAIVVHHRNHPRILETVEAILADGVAAAATVVVDNSEEAEITALLEADLPAGVSLLSVANRGYGHAANQGLEHLALSIAPEYVLVASHDGAPEPGTVGALLAAMRADERLAAVGPALLCEGRDGERFLSLGGTLSPRLNLPVQAQAPPTAGRQPRGPIARDWVDGAFCLYRADLLARFRFDESYFLYYEEVDLHVRLTDAGFTVACLPEVRAHQRSDGIPSYHLGRNLQLFQRRHGRPWQRLLAVPYAAGRRGARALVRREGLGEVTDLVRGWANSFRAD